MDHKQTTMKVKKWLIPLSLPLFLSGCFEGNKTTEQLCQAYPNLRCNKLNMDDGQCRVARTDLIWHRFEVLKDPSDKNKIREYQLVAEYRKCLELASQITPIDQTELKQNRFNALVHSIAELERIVKELSQSSKPESLYFLWSQTGSHEARRQFLQMEGSPQLETAEMQYALATFYTSRDAKKTLALLNHSLELTKDGKVNVDALKSLASTNQGLKRMKHAYLWAMVAKEFGVPLATQRELNIMFGFTDQEYEQLNELADEVVSALKSGQYRASLVPKTL
ncbi:DUF2989 domain-containing protein [Vibrio navarrensis]|uniref:DUF2989 domain-containing protein n=2 Tax=Vibrio navarrensis TaxID=29495 RepID=A0AAI9CSZ0_9VIBR|nr:DUF2989 domain-containing protein [Vibrio navarrensis]EGR2794507.1 DUF2989 domain-containing protein [Vibrio navarrensis]EHA1124510.1 DUF2989 domain-containing protein [Vibrio navarrensis]EJL6393991.1 DUF2989 domain-containing protein [Vibrio navarrensis]EJL6400575.1 DUF2989 domain-containing protein [Vibrio navarrensis]EJL6567673.1 DUF2989 domain-containing protein [Vibrio navarrensis]